MSKAIEKSTTAASSAATNDCDIELLQLGKAFRDVDARRYADQNHDDPLVHDWWTTAQQIIALRPMTNAGRRTTAYLLCALIRDVGNDGDLEACATQLAESILSIRD